MAACWCGVALAKAVFSGSIIAVLLLLLLLLLFLVRFPRPTEKETGLELALTGRPHRIVALEIAPVPVPVWRRTWNCRVRSGRVPVDYFSSSPQRSLSAGSGARAVDKAKGR